MQSEQVEQPSVITLNKTNSIQILIQYIEIVQKNGAYELKEAEILKRAIDVLVNNVQDKEINESLAINLLIQGIVKGQKHGGSFNLNDAALLQKVIHYIVSTSQSQENVNQESDSVVDNSSNTENVKSIDQDNSSSLDDLSSLSEPVPLCPKEI
jgi:hypothetical protein